MRGVAAPRGRRGWTVWGSGSLGRFALSACELDCGAVGGGCAFVLRDGGEPFAQLTHICEIGVDLFLGYFARFMAGAVEVWENVRQINEVFNLEGVIDGGFDEIQRIEDGEHLGAELGCAGDGAVFFQLAAVGREGGAGAVAGHPPEVDAFQFGIPVAVSARLDVIKCFPVVVYLIVNHAAAPLITMGAVAGGIFRDCALGATGAEVVE